MTYLFCKRITDVLVSTLALIVLSPIFFIVWIINVINASDRGPLLYKQVRVGLNGRKFGMYKFRSMVVNAEEKLYENKPLYAKYVKNNYKLKPEDDPRITKFGKFLRKSSIDEIPQFINILKGDMSLVGPRPVIEQELKEYDRSKLLSVKPGAMGLWQAVGRSKIGYPERANIEMVYIDKACFSFDIKIIFGNLTNIFKGKGAY
ncbi:sugar transferase (plasmid) [Companilactobacillus paralimentarius]|nr:sugar transferase [Companilactobacillus paralimentarius]